MLNRQSRGGPKLVVDDKFAWRACGAARPGPPRAGGAEPIPIPGTPRAKKAPQLGGAKSSTRDAFHACPRDGRQPTPRSQAWFLAGGERAAWPGHRERFTTGELAVLRIVSDEVRAGIHGPLYAQDLHQRQRLPRPGRFSFGSLAAPTASSKRHCYGVGSSPRPEIFFRVLLQSSIGKRVAIRAASSVCL